MQSRKLVRRTQGDGTYHDAVFGFREMWGYVAIFLAVANRHSGLDAARNRLQTYLVAKGYQLKADRCHGLLFDDEGRLDTFLYTNIIPRNNRELDALVLEMGLRNG